MAQRTMLSVGKRNDRQSARLDWRRASGTYLVKLSRRPAQILRAFALVANGLFVPLSLLGGLLSMVADIGPGEARSALVWSIILAAAASTVLVVLLSSENRRLLVGLAYLAAIGLLGFSFWLWIDHFNLLGLVFPPTEAIALGCLAAADLLALVTNRPLRPCSRSQPSAVTIRTRRCSAGRGVGGGDAGYASAQAHRPAVLPYEALPSVGRRCPLGGRLGDGAVSESNGNRRR